MRLKVARHHVRDGMSPKERWHMKLGHVNIRTMRKMDIPYVKFSSEDFMCDACAHGKVHSFAHPATRLDPPNYDAEECLHTDHRGPDARSLNGARYSQLYLDMKSKYRRSSQMSSRDGTYEATDKVIVDCCVRSGRRV